MRCLLILLALAPAAFAFTPLSSSQLVFVNVDHAPVGAGSTITYGYKGPNCGLGMDNTQTPFGSGGGGVVIALGSGTTLQVMPFVAASGSVSSTATFFPDATVQRTLAPCTDTWNIQSGALTWTHYTPAWSMLNLSTASTLDKTRFFLPATWMVFAVTNTTSQSEDFYFGLPQNAAQSAFAGGAYQGFATGEAALAVRAGAADLLTGASLTSALNGMTSGFAFHMAVPAGQSKSLTLVIAYYRSAVVDTRISASYYYTTLFHSVDQVIDTAMAIFPDAQTRCQELASAMQNASLNVYRQFLASDALHSYQSCTYCLSDTTGNVYWRDSEGQYNYINTFDLAVDHSFYETIMCPWALRNVLDAMSGLSTSGTGYTFNHPLYNPSTLVETSTSGFSFHHDMGQGLTSDAPTVDPTNYELTFAYMGQEELQNWILSAGVYWSRTDDNTWLSSNQALLQTCLQSMLLRDDVIPAERDGITSYINLSGTANHKEITTYDALDRSLQQPNLSGRTTVRSWASYLALQAMFTQNGDSADAATSGSMAAICANTIVSVWNTYRPSLGYIPAFLDDSDTAATIPMIEGLAYPQVMGLSSAVNMSTGPYATMLQDLKSHMSAILVPGQCLDATSGGWKLTSASNNTWQSKVYLCQYEAEKILGITGTAVDGTVDQIHATFEMTEAPYQGWSDQLNSTGSGTAASSLHYPRGITSILWWLSASTAPVFPTPTSAPSAPTGLSAVTNPGQVILGWTSGGLTSSFSVARSTSLSGPFTTIASGITGASFIDFTPDADGTFYYTVTGSNSAGNGTASTPLAVTFSLGSLPAPWTGQDIGSVGILGGQNYSFNSNAIGMLASGAGISGTADAFHFVSQAASGTTCTIIACVASIGSAAPSSEAGIMIRNSASPSDMEAAVVLTASNGVSFQWRSSSGGPTSFVPNPAVGGITTAPCWVELVRSGSNFTALQSPNGSTWTVTGSANIPMGTSTLVGLATTSENNSVLSPAVIDNVLTSLLPKPWAAEDMDSPGVAGSTLYSPNGAFVIAGSGADIQGLYDTCQFAYQPVAGDRSITAEVQDQTNTNPWAKAGVMIRGSLAANAQEVSLFVTPGNGISFQCRPTAGGNTSYFPNPSVPGITAPYWVQLTRSGNTFTASQSPDGATWTVVSSTTIAMGTSAYVGVPVTSHNNSLLSTASVVPSINTTPSFADWQAAWFTAAQLPIAAISDQTATPANDGTPNLVKYAFNIGPLENPAGVLPAVSLLADGNSTYLSLTYVQVIAAPDITYVPEVSSDLVNWNSGPAYIALVSAYPNLNGVTETVTVLDLVATSPNIPQFMRLVVTSP